MNTFSDELRKERIAKNISLSEISARTRISVKFLEAIEQGAFDVLPQTYVRAFIQEYAEQVGLPAGEILKKYEIMVTGKYAGAGGPMTGSGWSSTPIPSVTEAAPPTRTEKHEHPLVRYAIPATIAVVVVIAAIFIFDMEEGPAPPVRETPFSAVVEQQEHEQARKIARVDSSAAVALPPVVDSVVVNATTTDSVWVSVVRDGGPSESTILPPKATRVWRARERVIVTLGNAGGISFTVNGKKLGALGGRGSVLRHISFTHLGLERPGVK